MLTPAPSSFKRQWQDREITLITCHPMVRPTERLIVKGKI